MQKMIWGSMLLVFLQSFVILKKGNPVIHLIGDSTLAAKDADRRPETGWGEKLALFFEEGVEVKNWARNGRSSKSFLEEKRWDAVMADLQRGDYVFIQFGHNDAKTDERYADPEAYGANLTKYIEDARSKKAIPILITPIVRRRFDDAGQFYDTHGDYPEVMRKVAKKQRVPLLDLHLRSMHLLQSMGAEPSKAIFLWLEPGVHPNYPEGKQDNTHFSDKGALRMAELAVEEIRASNLKLKKQLKTP